jgi:hypothetical protein
MLQCPSYGAISISPKARKRLHLLWHMQCQACKIHLRLKWGRLLFLGYLAALALLVVGALVKIPGFHNFPAVVIITWGICLAASLHAINRRLPLEPKP